MAEKRRKSGLHSSIIRVPKDDRKNIRAFQLFNTAERSKQRWVVQ